MTKANQQRRVCIVSPEIVGPHRNGGIGTHGYYLARFLSQEMGLDVTYLYTGRIEQHDEAYWQAWFRRELGIAFLSLDAQGLAPVRYLGTVSTHADTANRVYGWMRQQTFDLCFFQDLFGHGFRCFQAKRAGVAFQDTILTCTLHSCLEWIGQAMHVFAPEGLRELQTNYLERYSMEQCDVAISPSHYMFQWARQNQIVLPARQHVLPYLFNPLLPKVGCRPSTNHVIFFGRLEIRKGLRLFLDALLELVRQPDFAGRPWQITFLGRSGFTPDGGGLDTIERYRERLPDQVRLHPCTNLNHHAAMAYLAEHNDAVVVCPSLLDNSPYAVIESLQLGLNLIAAQVGGIPELFADPARLFEPHPQALAAKIAAALRQELPPVQPQYSPDTAARQWADFCRTLLAQSPGTPGFATGSTLPTLRVFAPISSADHQANLDCVQGLQQQTFGQFNVTLLGDRTDAIGQRVAADRRFAFFDDSSEPTTDGFALLLSPGAAPDPALLATMIQAQRSSGAEVLACWLRIRPAESAAGTAPDWIYAPLGASFVNGLFGNVFGGGCLLIRHSLLPREAAEIRRLMNPDHLWLFLARLVGSGHSMEIVPEVLCSLQADTDCFQVPRFHYEKQREILLQVAHSGPPWLLRLLEHTAGAEDVMRELRQKLTEKEEQLRTYGFLSLGKLGFKIRRETKRLARQFRFWRQGFRPD